MNGGTIKHLITKAFHIFPISEDKYFFSSYEGKQFSCNPKYIYLQLAECYTKRKSFVWEYNAKSLPTQLDTGCSIVRHNTFLYLYHLLTSKYIITNTGISGNICLRREQVVLNTWHGGGAYKKVGAVIDSAVNGTDTALLRKAASQTSFFLSSSKIFTEIMVPSTLIDEKKFVSTGMPRNDIFFDKKRYEEAKKKVKREYRIPEKRIVLFAPTYRGDSGDSNNNEEKPDYKSIISCLQERFGGEWVFLYRAHYYFESDGIRDEFIIDASKYDDMQELLCAADILITDYSSSIWDFALTGKPCFLFVPDLDEYETHRGGFYSPIESWPGEITLNNEMLKKKIMCFDGDHYKEKINNHLKELESYEDGKATDRVMQLLR